MRLIVTYALILVFGFVIAYGLGLLGGLLWPAAAIPIFLIVAAWWIWTGWKYAVLRDRARKAAANLPDGPGIASMSKRPPRYVPAITGIFWVAVAVAVIALWPAPEGVLYWVRGALFAVTFLFGLDSLRIALFAQDDQIRRAVDGDAEASAAAHRELHPRGPVHTVILLLRSRRFVLLVIFAAVAAFFFLDQYVPQWGIVGNAFRGEILITSDCIGTSATGPCLLIPYRWIALAAVLVVGIHLILRAGRRA